jgi:hypothetical protein
VISRSKLLSLPVELRRPILRSILDGWVIHLYSSSCGTSHATIIRNHWKEWKTQSMIYRNVQENPRSILHVCRQLRAEATALIGACVKLELDVSRGVLSCQRRRELPRLFTEHCRHISFHIQSQSWDTSISFDPLAFPSLKTVTFDCGVVDLGSEYAYSLPGSISGWWHQKDGGMEAQALELARNQVFMGHWPQLLDKLSDPKWHASRSIEVMYRIGLEGSSDEGNDLSKVVWFTSGEIWRNTLTPKTMIRAS